MQSGVEDSVDLQVEGVDLTHEATAEAIASSDLSSALWSTTDGVVTATIFPASADIPAEGLRFAELLMRLIPGATVVRIDIASAADVAAPDYDVEAGLAQLREKLGFRNRK